MMAPSVHQVQIRNGKTGRFSKHLNNLIEKITEILTQLHKIDFTKKVWQYFYSLFKQIFFFKYVYEKLKTGRSK